MSGAKTCTSMCLEPQVHFFWIQSFFLLTFHLLKQIHTTRVYITNTNSVCFLSPHTTWPLHITTQQWTVMQQLCGKNTLAHWHRQWQHCCHRNVTSQCHLHHHPDNDNDNCLLSHRITRLTTANLNTPLRAFARRVCIYSILFLHLQGSRRFSSRALGLFYTFSYYNDNTLCERLLAVGIFYITNIS